MAIQSSYYLLSSPGPFDAFSVPVLYSTVQAKDTDF